MKTFKHGDKVKIQLIINAELCTDLDRNITEEELLNMINQDDAYGLKSIIADTIDNNTNEDHDTELLFENYQIKITKLK